jgi:phytoene synthase
VTPELIEAYACCRRLNAQHGRTYFLATRLLSARQRPAIHALYGFARRADDIVDTAPPDSAPADVAARLSAFAGQLRAGLDRGCATDPVIAAVVDTAARYRIAHSLFEDFLTSMEMDLRITDYADRGALESYVHGSAAVIGLEVLPVLGTVGPVAEAAPYAAALGRAFQLTNFLRDVDEDLGRGRIYLPLDELAAHDVDRDRLRWCREHARTDHRVRLALAAQHDTIRTVYRAARPGIDLLHPVSRPCVRTAAVLYGEILDRIAESGYAVFGARARVSAARKARVAAAALPRAWLARCPAPGRARLGAV